MTNPSPAQAETHEASKVRPPLVPEGERVILWTRPSALFVPLWPLYSLALILVASAGGAWLLGLFADSVGRGDRELYIALHRWATWLALAGIGAILLRLLWQVLEWRCRRYVLTDRRLVRVTGVLRQDCADIPLQNIQHLTMHRSLRERLAGLGTIGINTSGTALTEAYWVMMPRPAEVLATIRAAAESAGKGRERRRPIVIGLAGGIGSGKSAVAKEFARLGALVSDSDLQAREVLARPGVRDRLVEWWGPGVLDPKGSIDRGAVARIIFKDENERRRLEGLIHPLVRELRAGLVAQARAKGAEAVIIDAPLLFEAGIDKECDRVVFVEAPREQRVRRVMEGRGWAAGNLEEREKVQMPLEEKRARADDIIINDGDRQALALRVRDLLEHIRRTVT